MAEGSDSTYISSELENGKWAGGRRVRCQWSGSWSSYASPCSMARVLDTRYPRGQSAACGDALALANVEKKS